MNTPLSSQLVTPNVASLLEEAQRAERAGQREIARRRYETALYLLRAPDSAAAATILRRIARTYMDEGHYEAALDCLAAGLGVAEAQGDVSGIAHATNWIANTETARGDLDAAEHHYALAERHATAVGDRELNAMIAQNRGIIASMRGDLAAALDHFATSLVVYRTAGLREYFGPVLNNMGLVYTQLDRLDEAQASYDEALGHCDAAGDKPNRVLTLINSASLWIARGDLDRAAAVCASALCDATELGNGRLLAETRKHLGVIARMRGRGADAERELAAAHADAIERGDLLLAAESAREQAVLYEQMEKPRETLQALSLSHGLYTRLRSRRDLADLQQRVARLEHQFHDIVSRWAQTIESKDASTRGHCDRVADYACALARDAGFDDITLFWFRIGALLHDVGKIIVPSEILNKPGLLDAAEREMMERHAAAGSDLLRDIEFPWDILPMVRGHHERWDGEGYPDRLSGEQIDISARITCIADVFDALTTDRPYRRGFSREDTLAMMSADSGRRFDPALFARFERLIRTTDLHRPGPAPADTASPAR